MALDSKDGKTGLIASAASREALEKCINEYFFSANGMSITETGQIYSKNKGRCLEAYRAYKKGQRWRFEIIYDKEMRIAINGN
jgi:hypothetical protein